jgi:cyclic pyranopterin monophosphate synthase
MLTHISSENLPQMVDISSKVITSRTATAETYISLPKQILEHIKNDEIFLKKGPVIQTSIIAGTMAVKKTYELIPFCHQIPIDSCDFKITFKDKLLIQIICTVKSQYKTGVEMEALTGASIAALTIYDMCKAVGQDMKIFDTKLLKKFGGKTNYNNYPTYGLILTGGKSTRMEKDKALLNYHGKPHALHLYELLKPYCQEVFISCRENQWKDSLIDHLPKIHDNYVDGGPLGGIVSAFEKYPEARWMILACDLPFVNETTIKNLLDTQLSDEEIAICYKNKEKGFPEALCGLYTPSAYQILKDHFSQNIFCPVKVLKNSKVKLIEQNQEINLANINTKQEYKELKNESP